MSKIPNKENQKWNKYKIKNQRAQSAFLKKRQMQFKMLHRDEVEEKEENEMLKEKIAEMKEEYNEKVRENKILLTKIHSSKQEQKKMFDLKNKIKDFLISNNDDKKKVNSEMEIFFLKKEVLNLNQKLQAKSSKIQKLKNESSTQIENLLEKKENLEKTLIGLLALKQMSSYSDKQISKIFENMDSKQIAEQIKMQELVLSKLMKNNDFAVMQLMNLHKNIDEIEKENQETENHILKKQKEIINQKSEISQLKTQITQELKHYGINQVQE